jgi:hypothetical protein
MLNTTALSRRPPAGSAAYGLGGGGLRGGLGGGLRGGEGCRGGEATWYPIVCIGLGQQGRSCYSIAVATQSGRHETVHSDPPAASHPRTGGRRRSRRVATPLVGTICTSGFG